MRGGDENAEAAFLPSPERVISGVHSSSGNQSVTAIALLPPGLLRKIEADLGQMMAGAVEVLNEAGCALVGGHTGEGREVSLGLAVNRLVDESLAPLMRKGGMRPGDVLLLTKPNGTGLLFAAHARLAAQGRWIDEALRSREHEPGPGPARGCMRLSLGYRRVGRHYRGITPAPVVNPLAQHARVERLGDEARTQQTGRPNPLIQSVGRG